MTPKEPNLFVNNSDVPSLSEGLPVYGPLNQYGLMGESSLGPITVGLNAYDPSTFANDNSPMNEAAGYPNYYNSTGIDTADDRFRREAAANLLRDTGNNSNTNRNPNPGGGNSGGGNSSSVNATPVSNVLNTRTFPFTSRTPSGSVYAPDLSAYNDSSLFNYEGPGGVPEYTYGQGLRHDGDGYSKF